MSMRNADVAPPAPPTAAPPAAPEGAWLGAGFSGGLLSAEPPRPPSVGPSAVAVASEAARTSSATGAAVSEPVPAASEPGAHLPIEGPRSGIRPQPKLSLSARTVLAAPLRSEEFDSASDAGFTGASWVGASAGGTPDSALAVEAGMTSLAVEPRPPSGGSAADAPPPACSVPLAPAPSGSCVDSGVDSGVDSVGGGAVSCASSVGGADSAGGGGASAAGGVSGGGAAGGGDSASGAGSVDGGLSGADSVGGGGSDAGSCPDSGLEPGDGSETASALALAARIIAASSARVSSRRQREPLETIRAGRFLAIRGIVWMTLSRGP